MLPQQRAVGCERRQDALRALDIDVSRFAIDRGTCSGVAQVDGVTQVIIVEMLPELLPGFGVEAGYALLQVRSLACVAHHVELAIGDHRRRLPGKISPPKRALG